MISVKTIRLTSRLLPALALMFLSLCPLRAESLDQDINYILLDAYRLSYNGQYGPAAEKLTVALLTDPGNETAREELSRISRIFEAEKARAKAEDSPISKEERRALVRLAYESMRKTSPDIIGTSLIVAGEYEKRGFNTLACKTYLETLAMPGIELKTKHQIEKRLAKATHLVKSKIETLPDRRRTQYREAFTLMSVGNWTDSVEVWQTISQSTPEDKEIQELLSLPESQIALKEKYWIGQGKIFLHINDPQKAEVFFRKVLQINPESHEAMKGLENVKSDIEVMRRRNAASKYVQKARSLIEAGQNYDAIGLLLEALKENPDDNRALSLIADIQRSESKRKHMATRKSRVDRKQERGLGDEEETFRERDTVKAETHYQRGLVYYGMRNMKEALSEWKIAVEYDPNYQKAERALERVKSDLRLEK